MTKDDIVRMARQVGWSGIYAQPLFNISLPREKLLNFAKLVAEAEREECAKIIQQAGLPSIAAAIRARGKE